MPALSGPDWTKQFPTSRSIDDLIPQFADKRRRFIAAMEKAGAQIKISATKRPPERAYLMHFAWCIVNQGFDPRAVVPHKSVDIDWWHGDLETSVKAARAMVESYGLQSLKVAPICGRPAHRARGRCRGARPRADARVSSRRRARARSPIRQQPPRVRRAARAV
jgi:hypothetical protein